MSIYTYISPRHPQAPQPRIMGRCKTCNEELREDYTYFTDENDQTFCCLECALEHYQIKEVEWEYD